MWCIWLFYQHILPWDSLGNELSHLGEFFLMKYFKINYLSNRFMACHLYKIHLYEKTLQAKRKGGLGGRILSNLKAWEPAWDLGRIHGAVMHINSLYCAWRGAGCFRQLAENSGERVCLILRLQFRTAEHVCHMGFRMCKLLSEVMRLGV